jgi:hypothetical protein
VSNPYRSWPCAAIASYGYGATTFVTITGADSLAFIEMDRLVVVDTLNVARQPTGLAVLQAHA